MATVFGGAVYAAYIYDPWGNMEGYFGDMAKDIRFLYTGREYDWQTGGYHYRARAYDANLGRFLQRDPAGMVDGTNMYLYCGNDPVNRVDPGGKYANTDLILTPPKKVDIIYLWEKYMMFINIVLSNRDYTSLEMGTRGGESEYSDQDIGTSDCILKCLCKAWGGTNDCDNWDNLLSYNRDCYSSCMLTSFLYTIMWIGLSILHPPDWRPSGGFAHI